jgi:gas vesicle protein
MFGFNKKKKEEQKKHRGLDKIVMGMILGGAIGSVLGIGLAPKKGSDTRKLISKKASELYNDAKDAVTDAAEKVSEAVTDAAEKVSDKAHQMIDNATHKEEAPKEEPKKEEKKALSARDKIKEIPDEQ